MNVTDSPMPVPTLGSFSDNCEVFDAAVRAFKRGDYEGGCCIATRLLAQADHELKSRMWLSAKIEKLLLDESDRHLRGHKAA